MLDFQDVNKNGNYSEELPLDSLENPDWSRYNTYKYSFGYDLFVAREKTVLVRDTNWVVIEGDTVISRNFEILDISWAETIADKFGIIYNSSESPTRYLTGAVIKGEKYGTIVSVDEKEIQLPTDFVLEENYPNPFNSYTTIGYSIPLINNRDTPINLAVYDVLGKVVATLIDEYKEPGNYSITFDAKDLSSGVYFYSLISG